MERGVDSRSSILHLLLGAALAGLVFLPPASCLLTSVHAEEPLADQVRKSIDRGVQFLRTQQHRERDNWEITVESTAYAGGYPGGWTSLALLALLNAGVPPDDPLIQRGLVYLRTVEPKQTYVVGLQTMVFALADQDIDRPALRNNVKWLIDTRKMEGGRLLGWGYPDRGDRPDNSNTQYALLGLYEAHRAGVKIEPEVWRSIREFYTNTQKSDGSWGYDPHGRKSSLTMTTAGLCGLLIAGMELNEGREKFLANGSVENCGNYGDEENRPVRKALDWVGEHFPSAKDIGTYPHSDVLLASPTYYSLYGIERAGRLSGQRFFGKHDWYRVGCEFLVNNQQGDGSWKGASADGDPILATSFALLFLSRGRTPVLISKLAYGPAESQDWNNDRNDTRNLVEFTSRELFKKKPLAWQVFDPRRCRRRPCAGK